MCCISFFLYFSSILYTQPVKQTLIRIYDFLPIHNMKTKNVGSEEHDINPWDSKGSYLLYIDL